VGTPETQTTSTQGARELRSPAQSHVLGLSSPHLIHIPARWKDSTFRKLFFMGGKERHQPEFLDHWSRQGHRMNASEKNKKRNKNYNIRPKENEEKKRKEKRCKICGMKLNDSILQEHWGWVKKSGTLFRSGLHQGSLVLFQSTPQVSC
jgi:hypothetical protein